MAAAQRGTAPQNRQKLHAEQATALNELRTAFNAAAVASGAFNVQTVKTISAGEKLTNGIREQKVGWSQARKELAAYRKEMSGKPGAPKSALGDAIRQQTALRNSMATQWPGGNAFGPRNTDMYIPKNLGSDLDNINTKYGMVNRLLASAAHQTVNWGKNTQWAGRQIMVGLTVPLGMLAVGAGAIALKVDQELTRVAKVYDTVATTAEGRERELTSVRNVGLTQASNLAQEYGTKMEEVIDIQAQLAATGLNGNALFSSTREASRIATLGEMDMQSSVDMTVSLQTAFRDTIKTAEDLTDTFNFFNSVENATSLAIKDIAEAVPRAASAMAALGVDAREMTVMLVAMKESGVDAAEAANALKSGATRILDPTREAVQYWKDVLGKDLPAIVDKAGGNMFEFIKEVSVALNGLDPQTVQTAVAKTFGTYQFNRITALIGNVGDALTGTANQTAKGFELLGVSAEENAVRAEQELSKLQESMSFKFKAAVQSIKAELVPLGEAALKVGTFLLNNFIKPVIEGFNSLSGFSKGFLITVIGIGALVGPLLMLAGIFANLFGNVAKATLWVGNLKYKFSALSVEERAQAINARTAASAFQTEAAASANLASQIAILTRQMEANAIAAGHMMAANGKINNVVNGQIVGSRQVVQRSNGSLMYGAGSTYAPGTTNKKGQDISGKNAAGHPVRAVDAERWKEIQRSAGSMATSAAATERHMSRAGAAVGAMAVGALSIGAMMAGSEGINQMWANTAMVVAMIAMMAPGLFAKPFVATWGILKNLKTAGGGAVVGRLALGAASIAGSFQASKAAGAGMTRSLGAAGGTLARMLPMALRVFGPLGAIAAGAWYLKKMDDEMGQVADNAVAVGKATEQWAEAQGWDFNPGQMPGMKPEDVKGHQARIELIDKMTEANKDLDDAMVGAAQAGHEFDTALDMAMSALMAGASIKDAEEIFQAALDMAGLKETEIDKLTLRFRNLDLEDPENLREQLNQAINGLMGDVEIQGNIRPDDNDDGFWGGIGAKFGEAFGRDLTPEAEAAGSILGSRFSTAFVAAGEDKLKLADTFNAAEEQYNAMFANMYNSIKNESNLDEAFKQLGISGASSFVSALKEIREKNDAGKELNRWEEQINEAFYRNGDVQDLEASADQMWDVIVDSMVNARMMTEAEGNLMKENMASLFDYRKQEGVPNEGLKTEAEALRLFRIEMQAARDEGIKWTQEEYNARRAHYLAAAGIEEGSLQAKQFGNKALEAAHGVARLAAETEAAKVAAENLAAGLMTVTPDDLIGAQKDAMTGTMSDIFGEADRQFQDMQAANLDAIRASGDARQDAMRRDAELVEADFDRREAEAEWFWAVREEAFENEWDARQEGLEAEMDSRIEAEESYWDSRIEGIEDAIEAEQKAEEKRQEIFENEQRRIDRMASSLNSNIDFNVALNSGDLDEAAKIANDSIAQQNSWSLEDQNRDAQSASEARVEALNGQLEELNTLKEAKLDEVKAVKEARMAALKEEQESAQKQFNWLKALSEQQLQNERDAARAKSDAAIEADRLATEADLKRTQTEQEAQRRAMEIELKTLQEFIPKNEEELRKHTEEVTKVYAKYGLDLQTEGGKWGAFVGEALRVNVEAASIAMQSQIDWRAIAANIAAQIGEGLGMTMQQVQEFLRTGVFPATPPVAPVGPVLPGKTGANSSANAAERRAGWQHIGGPVPFTGGNPLTSQRDRTGISRSNSLYPSEVPTVLKSGEYVVNDKASRKNRGILDAINAGKDIGGTGLLEHTAAQVTGQMGAVAQVMGLVAYEKVRQGKAAYEAQQAAMYSGGGGSTGTLAGGNMPWERLWNTIKGRFPKAGLNSSVRPGDPGYHGKGMAVDLGLAGTPGGAGNSYMADMNRWIYDNFRGSTELIYNGLGDDRPNLFQGRDHAYNASTQAQHRNHVHWAMTPEAIAAAGRMIASGGLGPTPGGGTVRDQVLAAANARGWGAGANWAAIDWVINKESGWRPDAQNPVSSASGLFQHIDATWNAYKRPGVSAPKMRLAPVNEQAWAGMNYFAGRYGSPANARAFWEKNRWYDNGGYLMPGENQIVSNGTRVPEPVFTGPQWDILKANIGTATYDVPRGAAPMPVRVVDNVANGGETRYDVTVDLRGAVVKDDIDFQAAVEKAIDNIEVRKGRRRTI